MPLNDHARIDHEQVGSRHRVHVTLTDGRSGESVKETYLAAREGAYGRAYGKTPPTEIANLSHRFEIVDPPVGTAGFDATVAIIGPEVDGGEDQVLPILHVLFEPGTNGDPRGTLETMIRTANAAMTLHLIEQRRD